MLTIALIVALVAALALWLNARRYGRIMWRENVVTDLNENPTHAYFRLRGDFGRTGLYRLTHKELGEARDTGEKNRKDVE